MAPVSIGVDIGQKHDPTAIAVVQPERRTPEEGGSVWHYLVRHLERLPLGTSYPEVGRRVAAVVTEVVAKTGSEPILYVDATGVGTPVVDALRGAGVRAKLVAVYFTHGDRRQEEGSQISLGKGWLVSGFKCCSSQNSCICRAPVRLRCSHRSCVTTRSK